MNELQHYIYERIVLYYEYMIWFKIKMLDKLKYIQFQRCFKCPFVIYISVYCIQMFQLLDIVFMCYIVCIITWFSETLNKFRFK